MLILKEDTTNNHTVSIIQIDNGIYEVKYSGECLSGHNTFTSLTDAHDHYAMILSCINPKVKRTFID